MRQFIVPTTTKDRMHGWYRIVYFARVNIIQYIRASANISSVFATFDNVRRYIQNPRMQNTSLFADSRNVFTFFATVVRVYICFRFHFNGNKENLNKYILTKRIFHWTKCFDRFISFSFVSLSSLFLTYVLYMQSRWNNCDSFNSFDSLLLKQL